MTGLKKHQDTKKELISLVDADTRAFEGIMAARSLPKITESEKAIQNKCNAGSHIAGY